MRSVFARVTAALRSASFWTVMSCPCSSDKASFCSRYCCSFASLCSTCCRCAFNCSVSQSDASFDDMNLNSRFCWM